MKHTLLCFIFLTLQDGNTGLVKAQTLTHRAEEGGSITVKCNFYFPGSRKLFCKEKCEDGNILVQTSDDAAQNGRYSIKYENSNNIMYVSITQLKQSDSGWYRCSLDRVLVTDGNSDFELIVTEASTTSTPNGTLRPFSASVFLSSASTPPTAQSLSSTSGSSTPSSASSGSSDVLIYVRLIVVIIISAFLATSLIFYMMKRTAKPRGPPVESERADITQGNNVYIEIREVDRQSSSPPAEVSSTDAAPKTSNQMEMKTIDLYSLSTSPHNKVHASSADHTADASPPHMSKNISSDAADESLVANR
ncbi:triggering receptor expressed on myeloid cells 1 isoform X4 [Haplochromis burtoni]|uniref:triggering receptor expressed on myeloid cells 1 isoform X4 n=1 Tax=Haplochromis burtoni TaxID=8153 RepID=UPI001C2D6751|nr:triggering receptor expressed on myeloid cells 1 isoform X4 [Haplochromis burtoni]XP_042071635.1 triggering receptor expressed on myeloid cells 1 isoform X4 [Haplochromis burtoni]